MVYMLSANFTGPGTVEAFNTSAFAAFVAELLGVPREDVTVRVRAASIIVMLTVRFDTEQRANVAAARLNTTDAGEFNTSVGVPLTLMGPPRVDALVMADGNSASDNGGLDNAVVVILVMLAVLICLICLGCFLVKRNRRNGDGSERVSTASHVVAKAMVAANLAKQNTAAKAKVTKAAKATSRTRKNYSQVELEGMLPMDMEKPPPPKEELEETPSAAPKGAVALGDLVGGLPADLKKAPAPKSPEAKLPTQPKPPPKPPAQPKPPAKPKEPKPPPKPPPKKAMELVSQDSATLEDIDLESNANLKPNMA